MKKNLIIKKSRLCCLISIAVFSFIVLGSDKDHKSLIDSNSTTTSLSYKERQQLYTELSQLKESTIQQRNELINKLINIIKEDKLKYVGVYDAMDLLGQIRATEATDILLEKIDYKGPAIGIAFPTVSPKEYMKDYHAVKALVNIHPPCEIILTRLRDVNNNINFSFYVAILVGMEGPDISYYLIEKAMNKESDKHILERLNSALDILKKYYPMDNNDMKQK
jgi:hypothetical protein